MTEREKADIDETLEAMKHFEACKYELEQIKTRVFELEQELGAVKQKRDYWRGKFQIIAKVLVEM